MFAQNWKAPDDIKLMGEKGNLQKQMAPERKETQRVERMSRGPKTQRDPQCFVL